MRIKADREAANAWYAIRVRTRFEAVAASALEHKGYEVLLPRYRSNRVWSDRIKPLDLPVFPGYVFCVCDPHRLLPVLSSPGVMYVVSAGTAPLAIPTDEVDGIAAMCASGVGVRPWPFLRTGRRVVVERGPLAGIEGIVVQVKNDWRLVLSISILQRSVSAELERDSIRPIDAEERTVKYA